MNGNTARIIIVYLFTLIPVYAMHKEYVTQRCLNEHTSRF